MSDLFDSLRRMNDLIAVLSTQQTDLGAALDRYFGPAPEGIPAFGDTPAPAEPQPQPSPCFGHTPGAPTCRFCGADLEDANDLYCGDHARDGSDI